MIVEHVILKIMDINLPQNFWFQASCQMLEPGCRIFSHSNAKASVRSNATREEMKRKKKEEEEEKTVKRQKARTKTKTERVSPSR